MVWIFNGRIKSRGLGIELWNTCDPQEGDRRSRHRRFRMTHPIAFELERYTHIPAIFPADDHRRPGVKSLFFQNEEYLARETRVFGWMGMPYLREGDTCPAMVLVHGGRGTAFDEWVRLWNGRGYAAIAVDLCGCAPRIPTPQTGIKYDRHDSSVLPRHTAPLRHSDPNREGDKWLLTKSSPGPCQGERDTPRGFY